MPNTPKTVAYFKAKQESEHSCSSVLKHNGLPFVRNSSAAPFLKWAGGKRRLIPYLTQHFPDQTDIYWEPFVGGGAVFFTMADRIDHAVLSDVNKDLIITYQVVQTRVDDLIAALKIHQRNHLKFYEYYQRVRAQEPQEALEIASRFIYLNKTCYNGLYRVNSRGKFNVPRGIYKNPDICNEDRLREASKVLAKAEIRVGDFEKIVQPSADDFVYCDPPYDECFTNYKAGGFTKQDQERLKAAIDTWVEMGAKIMANNSDTPFVRKLYQQRGMRYALHEAEAPRMINAKASGRGSAAELIITSYG